jgi:hypothetical protein
MGEFADAVLNGEACQECMMLFDDAAPGYPRTCKACGGDDDGLDGRIAEAVRDLGYPRTADAMEAKSKARKRGKKGRRG